jgi:hypothetical protein
MDRLDFLGPSGLWPHPSNLLLFLSSNYMDAFFVCLFVCFTFYGINSIPLSPEVTFPAKQDKKIRKNK